MDDLKWEKKKYGGAETLTLAKGWVRLYVGWALVPKGEKGHFMASINGETIQGKFESIDMAKRAAVNRAFKIYNLATEQLKNFVEG